MKKSELYFKTVGILEQAYINDTLVHGNCFACAVGNLVATGINVKMRRHKVASIWQGVTPQWDNVFCSRLDGQEINPDFYCYEAKRQIDSTGYSWQELAQIEKAFETAPQGNSDDEWMFNGLMAVIDVLDIIHENTDVNVTSSTKKKFIHA